ncbi:MAG: cytidylate kinase family protein [Desulfobacca sp.]|uniref:cytidylate kinase family protein n=1 Tax=Desulfobacca sp. TaxID=2067990 RepID=UPI00404AF93B
MAILAISREYGAGGRDIGRQVAQRLKYAYVDKERLFQELDQWGRRWGQTARELDEVCPTFWERHDWQYRGYLAALEALIFAYAAADRVVLIGRGAYLLLQEVPFCLKVRLVAPLAVRVERIMVRESLDQERAEDLIARVDRDRACYLQANYGKDWNDESNYDLILNTGSLSYDQVADLLCKELVGKEQLATPAAKVHLADLALARRLQAKIATDPRLLAPTVQVQAADGVIVVTGVIHNPKELAQIQEIAREVCGPGELRFELTHR